MVGMILKAEKRAETNQVKAKNLLKDGFLPAVVYGPAIDNLNLKLKIQDFLRVFNEAGETQVIELEVDGQTKKVLINQIQRDPVTDQIIHADFYEFQKGHRFNIEVPINFTGESKAVREEGAILVTSLDKIAIQCLYEDLISEIEVDLSKLENINDAIRVEDLNLGEKINIVSGEDQVIVSVKMPKIEEEPEVTESESETTESESESETEKEASEGEASEGENKEENSASKEENKE